MGNESLPPVAIEAANGFAKAVDTTKDMVKLAVKVAPLAFADTESPTGPSSSVDASGKSTSREV